jgi:SIR2-like domain
LGDALALKAEDLPRPLRALAKIEAAQVRPKRLEDDVMALIRRLETIAREQSKLAPKPVTRAAPILDSIPARADAAAPPPDDAHFEDILHQIVDRGNLVPVLGSRLTGGRGNPAEGSGSLPSAEELAADLAKRFGVASPRLDLAEVAQYVYVTKGRPDLYLALREILTADREPGPVHRFLAGLPQTLEGLGLEKRYQLIVSTNFDTALEQAFDDAGEPYDLAVYMAEEGKFIHCPYVSDSAVQVDVPNKYLEFPIGEDFDLWRTVIVKIHGAVDSNVGDYRWKGNYVITQDNYIDYLSRSPIESLVPVQVLDKLKESHCLFLGYTVRDWNLRVFLKRIWEEGRIEAQSWAVEPDPDALERQFWKKSSVDLYAADLADYVAELQDRLTRRAAESAEP